jgi:hypothetical protein
MQASNQLRGIGTTVSHPAARVQSSGIQTVVTSSTTSQSSHVGSNPQMPLKQGVCMLPILYDCEKVLILQVNEVEIAIAKLKKYKSPGSDQVLAELIQSDQVLAELIQGGGEILLSAIHKLINSVWNKEELPDQWKESIIVPIHKKGDKTDCNYYHGISLLSTSYKMLSNILLPRLSPYIDEIIGDHQCGFRRNRSTTDQIFCY